MLIVAYGPFQYGSWVWVTVYFETSHAVWSSGNDLGRKGSTVLDRARPIPIVLDRLPTLSVKLSAFGISWFRQTHPDKNSNVLLISSVFYLSALRALQAEPCCIMPVLFYDLQAGRITSACLVHSWWHSHNIPMMDELSPWSLGIGIGGFLPSTLWGESLGFLLVQIHGFPRFDHFS